MFIADEFHLSFCLNKLSVIRLCLSTIKKTHAYFEVICSVTLSYIFMKKEFLVFVLSSLFLCCTSNSFHQKMIAAGPAITFTDKVDSVVINKMNEYNIPGLSIGIVKNNTITYTRGYGIKSIDTRELVTEHTVFHTASISKIFTALAIVQLEEEQYLHLNDKIVELVPELKFNDERVKKITLKHLLNHTSGLPDIKDYNWDHSHTAKTSLRDFILGQNLKVESEPGIIYSYSNLGYNILGYIIEKVTSTSFEGYMKNNLLNNCKMYNSDFRYFKIPDSLKVSPHSKSWITGRIYEREVYPYNREHAPSSTLNSSVKELSNWMISFFKILDSTSSEYNYKKMLEPDASNPHISLGFQLYSFESKKAIGHYGGDKGFRSFLMMMPEEKIGLIVLANSDYKEDFRQEIIYSIVKQMLNK